MVRRLRVSLLGVVLAVLLPATAGAQSSVAPPGNSAVDQYRESVPEPDGPRRSLSERERSELRRLGDDGVALATTLDRQGGVAAAEPTATAGDGGKRDQSRDRAAKRAGSDRDDADRGDDAPAAGGGTTPPSDDRGAAAVSTSAVGSQLPLGWMAAIAVLLATVGIVRWRRA